MTNPKDIVCVRGPILGNSGYTRATRNIIKGMHLAEKKFYIDPIPWATQPSAEVPDEFHKIIKEHLPSKESHEKTAGLLTICTPSDLISKPSHPNTYIWTIFETTKIPEEWVRYLNMPGQNKKGQALNGIIVPIKGNAEQSFALAKPEKHVVPLAIDYELFGETETVPPLKHSGDFNILLCYHANHRKNPEFIIEVINHLSSDYTVYLKTYVHGFSTIERLNIAHELSDKINSRAKVVLLYDIVPDEDMKTLYNQMDLVLNLSHGEGWDLPRVEAISCGTPAIGTNFMGALDYVVKPFDLIEHKLVDCPDLPPYFSSEAQWANLNLMQVIQSISQVKNNYQAFMDAVPAQKDHLMKHTGTLADMGARMHDIVMSTA